MKAQLRPLKVALTGSQYRELVQHLLPGDGLEAVAFAVCGRTVRQGIELLTVRRLYLVPHADCKRTDSNVVWPGAALEALLRGDLPASAGVVKFHSHPSGFPDFSSTDDLSDRETFETVDVWQGREIVHASVLMLPGGVLRGRAVCAGSAFTPLAGIRVAGDDFLFFQYPVMETESAAGRRVMQAFGDKTFSTLRSLRIGVVGASGTGSLVVEQCARNCAGEVVIVDAQDVEAANLNRIVNSTQWDADAQVKKVNVLKRAVDAMGTGTRVTALPCDLADNRAIEELATCDVLFGCMDSVDGRHILNRLATTYSIPLIDVGVNLEADGVGGIDSIWAVVHTVLPGEDSLYSRKVYTMDQLTAAFERRSSPDEYGKKVAAGYLRDVDVERPAVISVNMVAAATAVGELLARLHPYRVSPNSEYRQIQLGISDPAATRIAPAGAACAVHMKHLGTGDQSPCLGLPLLEVPRC